MDAVSMLLIFGLLWAASSATDCSITVHPTNISHTIQRNFLGCHSGIQTTHFRVLDSLTPEFLQTPDLRTRQGVYSPKCCMDKHLSRSKMARSWRL